MWLRLSDTLASTHLACSQGSPLQDSAAMDGAAAADHVHCYPECCRSALKLLPYYKLDGNLEAPKFGRKDCMTSVKEAAAVLPSSTGDVDKVTKDFADKGFDPYGLAVLLGECAALCQYGRVLGRAFC